MSSLAIEHATDAERLVLEQAIAFFTQISPLAAGRHRAGRPRPPPRGRAPRGGAADPADGAGGQPDGHDDPPRRPQGARRGEKRPPAASGSSWWTRWG